MLSRRSLVLLLMAVSLLAACKRKPAVPPDVIARVGERTITLGDFKRYLERNAGSDLAQLTPEVSSAMLDQHIEEVVLSEHAAAKGIEVPAEQIATAVRNEAGATVIEKRDEMRREKLIANLTAELPEPSPADVAAYYQQHQDEFSSEEEVRVRQILVNDEALAHDLVKKARSGLPFEQLSADHSRAPNAKRGGEIGFVSRGELPRVFEQEIFELQPGEVSDAIRTDATFHIFKVEERRSAGMLDLMAATPLIVDRMKEEALRERLAQLVTQNRSSMRAAVLTRRLPFPYSGSLSRADAE